jgi:hypothetical protein
MQWKTIVNQGAELGFVTVKNDKADLAATVAGQVLVWQMDGTDDGLAVEDPEAATAALVVGLSHTAIATSTTGLAQVYGLDDDAIVIRIGSDTDDHISVGDIYDINSAGSNLKYSLAGQALLGTTCASNSIAYCVPPMFVAAGSVAGGSASSASTTTAKVFLRCL